MEMLKHLDIVKFIEEWKSTGNSPTDKKSLIVLLMKIIGAKVLPIALKEMALQKITKENNYINTDFWIAYIMDYFKSGKQFRRFSAEEVRESSGTVFIIGTSDWGSATKVWS